MAQSLDIPITAPSMLKFAFPTVVAQVFMGIYGIVDGLFVSNLVSTDALSAVNIFMPMLMIVMAISTMLGTGGRALVAKQLGEGKQLEARQNFSALIAIAAGSSAILCGLGLLFLDQMLFLLGSDEQLLPLCRDYAIPVLIFIPIAILGMVFDGFFIAEGKPEIGSALAIGGGFLNILLDWLFIAVLQMGIAGAAWASIIGYSLSAVVGFVFFACNRKGNICMVRPVFRKAAIVKMCTNGISEMIMMSSSSVVTIVINNIMIRLAGADGIAAISIIIYAESILATIYMGYDMGVSPLASFNYGKQDIPNLKAFFKINIIISIVACVVIFAGSLLIAPWVIGMFARPDTVVYQMACEGFVIVAFSFLFMSVNDFASSFFTALNDGKTSGIISFMRTFVFSLATLLTLPFIWGVTGLWLAMPAAEVLSLFVSVYYLATKRKVFNYA